MDRNECKSFKCKLCIKFYIYKSCRSQWPRGLRRRSAAARLLRSWVWMPLGAWMFVCCECCVLSGRGLCDELITRPEESYRLWCVVVCDLETSRIRRPWPALGRSATERKKERKKKKKHSFAHLLKLQCMKCTCAPHVLPHCYTQFVQKMVLTSSPAQITSENSYHFCPLPGAICWTEPVDSEMQFLVKHVT